MPQPFPASLYRSPEYPDAQTLGAVKARHDVATVSPATALVPVGGFGAVAGLQPRLGRGCGVDAAALVSRVSLAVCWLKLADAQAAQAPAPPVFTFRLFGVVGGQRALVQAFTWAPPTWVDVAPLLWWSGGLCEALELWGNHNGGGGAADVKLSLQWYGDRLVAPAGAVAGDHVTLL